MPGGGTSARYEGRPFLRLLECYVMWAIGELSPEMTEELDQIAPKLQFTYGTGGTWQHIVADQMEFSDTVPDALRGMWERTLTTTDLKVDCEEWARRIVDENFL